MMGTEIHKSRLAFAVTLAATLPLACGDESTTAGALAETGGALASGGIPGATGGLPASGGVAPAAGGAPPTGGHGGGGMSPGGTSTGGTSTGGVNSGTVGSGGATGGGASLFPFAGSTIELCPEANPLVLPLESFKPCNLVGCNMAHCVPETVVPESVPLELLGRCEDATTVCIPDDLTATFGDFRAKHCESLLGAEGRCLSTCIPQINGLMDALPRGECGDNERCAPCVNPNDGTDTGACEQGCDTGPSAETQSNPITFETCQGGEGVCTPREIIPEALLTHLVQYDCPSPDQVCSPLEKAQNLKYNFAPCTPTLAGIIAVPGPDGQLGGCVPAWVADANPLEGIFLAQDTCAVGQKCAPCNNPLRFNIPTGACPVPLPSDPSGGQPPGDSAPSRPPN